MLTKMFIDYVYTKSKQILFVKELVHNEGKITATEAAIKAGYPEATARSKASMLQNPKYYPLVVDSDHYVDSSIVTFDDGEKLTQILAKGITNACQ